MFAIILINFARDLPDLQALPQPCFIKNKTDIDNIEIDKIITTITTIMYACIYFAIIKKCLKYK